MEEIKVYINDYNSLFNTFDKNDISDELAIYIENRCSRLKHSKTVIKFISSTTIGDSEKVILIFKNILPLLNTLLDIFDIFACFIIWESAYNLLFTDNEADVKITRSKKIISAKIEFIVD